MSVPTPITPTTAPSGSRTGEYHASNTAPNTSTVDESVSPVRARRTSAIACGKSANRDRKSTRLNSSHLVISYAVFCLKKKKTPTHRATSTSVDNRHLGDQ